MVVVVRAILQAGQMRTTSCLIKTDQLLFHHRVSQSVATAICSNKPVPVVASLPLVSLFVTMATNADMMTKEAIRKMALKFDLEVCCMF